MCIIIDTSAFASVFNPNSQNHNQFEPVLDWIVFGRGKIVYGGAKYLEELTRAQKYLRLFTELDRQGKIVHINDEEVDREQQRIEELIGDPDFDDPHLVAIVSVSRCNLICSEDRRAYPFLKDRQLYPKGCKPPKIYSSRKHKALLIDANIARVCMP